MRKVIAAFNMTLDGVCDHTTGIADKELHQHYAELIDRGGVILYGRTTFQLMQFWQELLKKPSGEKAMDDFALAIDQIPKLIFSNSLISTDWDSAQLASKSLIEEIVDLKKQEGKAILIGSRSLIMQLLNVDLIDEFQICIHPVIEGKGLKLFEQINKRIHLKLIQTKSLGAGQTVLYYEPISRETTNSID